jgi:hypothetical protein
MTRLWTVLGIILLAAQILAFSVASGLSRRDYRKLHNEEVHSLGVSLTVNRMKNSRWKIRMGLVARLYTYAALSEI